MCVFFLTIEVAVQYSLKELSIKEGSKVFFCSVSSIRKSLSLSQRSNGCSGLTWRAEKCDSCKAKPCNEAFLFISCHTGKELKDIYDRLIFCGNYLCANQKHSLALWIK